MNESALAALGPHKPPTILPATLPYATSTLAPAAAGTTIGDYEILAELGRGGMGIVYKARQKSLGWVVALKTLLACGPADSIEAQRFLSEAAAAAHLRHPNIVAVHDVGEANGKCFYTMDYFDGLSLAERLKAGPLPERPAAQYLLTIARAIQHAHTAGILHRDLKPGNILLDASDVPHLTDFGLAKRLEADSSQTRTGMILGTPSYMAPEQAAGTKDLGPACDVYGLGAVLYELLTGRPPFRSDTPLDTLLHVLERPPAPPRLLNPKLARDLETICLKCLEKDPRDRYPSAAALADDLERFLHGASISARSFNLLDRIARTLERSQHDVEFQAYGTMLYWFAVVMLGDGTALFWLTRDGPPYPAGPIILVRIVQFTLLGLVFWHYYTKQFLAGSTAARLMWSTWGGFLVGCFLHVISMRLSARADHRLDELTLYPGWSVLAGIAFLVMGSSYWGRCYAFGAAFFLLALGVPFALRWAPLLYGLLWTASLVLIGSHLRRLGHEAARATPPAPDRAPALNEKGAMAGSGADKITAPNRAQ